MKKPTKNEIADIAIEYMQWRRKKLDAKMARTAARHQCEVSDEMNPPCWMQERTDEPYDDGPCEWCEEAIGWQDEFERCGAVCRDLIRKLERRVNRLSKYKEQREEICGYKNKIANLQKTCDARRELISFLSVIVTKSHEAHLEYWGAGTEDEREKALCQFPIIQGAKNQIDIRKLGALPHDLTDIGSTVESILEEYKEELEEILGG
jgi:hypothetical protein